MNSSQPWILIALIVILIVALGVVALKRGKGKHKTDYRALFHIGVIWTVFGAVSMIVYDNEGAIFLILGLALLVVGLSRKDQWKTKAEIIAERKEQGPMLAILLGLALLIGFIVAYFLVPPPSQDSSITSFEECAEVYPVMESFPRQCAIPGGEIFVEPIEVTPEPGIAPEIPIEDYPVLEE